MSHESCILVVKWVTPGFMVPFTMLPFWSNCYLPQRPFRQTLTSTLIHFCNPLLSILWDKKVLQEASYAARVTDKGYKVFYLFDCKSWHLEPHIKNPLLSLWWSFFCKSSRLFHNLGICWAHKAFSLHESIDQHFTKTPPVHILPFQDILTLRTALLQLATAKSSDAASAWAQLERMAEDGQADAQAVMASEAWAA